MGQLPQGAEPRDKAAQQRHVDLKEGQRLNVGPSSGWVPVSSLSLWGVSARVAKRIPGKRGKATNVLGFM